MSVHEIKGKWCCKFYEKQKDGALKERREWFGSGDIARQQAIIRDDQIKLQRGKIKLESLSVAQVCQAYHQQHHVEDSTRLNDFYKFSRNILPELGSHSAETITTQAINS